MHSGYGGEDMFVVVVYDVHKSRCAKVMKLLRQWLEHRQRSVFAGFLSASQVKILQKQLLLVIRPKYDSVIIFQSNRATQVSEWTTHNADIRRRTGLISGSHEAPPKNRKRKTKKQNSFRFSKR
jgi:CRISPR-associated protein Cas2